MSFPNPGRLRSAPFVTGSTRRRTGCPPKYRLLSVQPSNGSTCSQHGRRANKRKGRADGELAPLTRRLFACAVGCAFAAGASAGVARYREATDVVATQIGDWRLNAFAGLCSPRGRSCQWPVALVGAFRTIYSLHQYELTYGTSQPSEQRLFCVVAAPCNPLPLSRTPQLSANTVWG